MSTGSLLNGVNAEGEASLRNAMGGVDGYLQALHLVGSRNTVSAFFYRGRTALEQEEHGEEPEEGGEETLDTERHFTRFGLRGNYLLFDRVDVVAGAALGRNRLEPSLMEIDSRGLFAELDVELTKRWIAVYRFDVLDPDTDVDDDAVRAHTLSTTFQADDHRYLTAEYQNRRMPQDTTWALLANARVIY